MEYFIEFINDLADEELHEMFFPVSAKEYFRSGGCYELAKIIKAFVPRAEIVVNNEHDHCGILYLGNIYDSLGKCNESDSKAFTIAGMSDIAEMEERFRTSRKKIYTWKRDF